MRALESIWRVAEVGSGRVVLVAVAAAAGVRGSVADFFDLATVGCFLRRESEGERAGSRARAG